MDTVRRVTYDHETPRPTAIDHELRMPPALVESLLADYTTAGDAVLDPFAGFGTTLRVADRLDRAAYGVEYERERVEYVRDRGHGRLVHGDATDLGGLGLPRVDCCLTSPPFMVREMTDDPLQNYDGESDYATYLDEMAAVFAGVRDRLRPGGHALVHVSNMRTETGVTTLAWDLADRLRSVIPFEGEEVVVWDDPDDSRDGAFGYGQDHSYCLVFAVPD